MKPIFQKNLQFGDIWPRYLQNIFQIEVFGNFLDFTLLVFLDFAHYPADTKTSERHRKSVLILVSKTRFRSEMEVATTFFKTSSRGLPGDVLKTYSRTHPQDIWVTLTSQCPLENDHKRQQICQIKHEKCLVVLPVFQVWLFYTS